MITAMKPFDLDEALAGNPVITRDGKEVTQLEWFDVTEGRPLVGVINQRGGRRTMSLWPRDGIFYGGNTQSPFDLLMAIESPVTHYEIRPLQSFGEDTGITKPDQAEFWGLYSRADGPNTRHIEDYPTLHEALIGFRDLPDRASNGLVLPDCALRFTFSQEIHP